MGHRHTAALEYSLAGSGGSAHGSARHDEKEAQETSEAGRDPLHRHRHRHRRHRQCVIVATRPSPGYVQVLRFRDYPYFVINY